MKWVQVLLSMVYYTITTSKILLFKNKILKPIFIEIEKTKSIGLYMIIFSNMNKKKMISKLEA